ncbi:MAG: conjugal transfer protein, partial [Acidimicrobiia bacterium]
MRAVMAPEDLAWWFVAAAVAVAVCLPWAGWELAHLVAGAPAPPGAPPATVAALIKGRATWPAAATWWTAVAGAVLAAASAALAWRGSGTHAVERAGRYLPRDRGLRRYTSATGPRIGHLTRGGAELRMTTEDQAVAIAGPRTGKTTRLAVPAALAARGPVLVTSNKRDIHDAIAGPRAERGRVWLSDPQGLAGGEPTWWWDPLTIAGDVRGARRLAAIWSQATRPADARTDAYFDPEGPELLASLLLAAATSGQRLSAVYGWLARPSDPAPATALDTAGHDLMAAGLRARQELPDKQRAGVYGTAAKIVGWLADPAVRRWVEPEDAEAVAFDAAVFVTSTDTLVSLSREGGGSSAPLVTALTAA